VLKFHRGGRKNLLPQEGALLATLTKERGYKRIGKFKRGSDSGCKREVRDESHGNTNIGFTLERKDPEITGYWGEKPLKNARRKPAAPSHNFLLPRGGTARLQRRQQKNGRSGRGGEIPDRSPGKLRNYYKRYRIGT